MGLEFKNRKGDIYYIKSKKTKTGKTTYFVTKKYAEDCLDVLPYGYEVFEKHDVGTLHVRKKKECKFSKKEISTVEKELSKNKSLAGYKLDILGDTIKIYVREKSSDMPSSFFGGLLSSAMLDETINIYGRYSEMMRIVVQKGISHEREFEIMRYCFRGSIDDWIVVFGGHDFKKVVEPILVHLGKESYYELYRWS
jgi:hypothetical protein